MFWLVCYSLSRCFCLSNHSIFRFIYFFFIFGAFVRVVMVVFFFLHSTCLKLLDLLPLEVNIFLLKKRISYYAINSIRYWYKVLIVESSDISNMSCLRLNMTATSMDDSYLISLSSMIFNRFSHLLSKEVWHQSRPKVIYPCNFNWISSNEASGDTISFLKSS